MLEFPLLYPERVADDTIRGFLYQVLWTTRCWLELGPQEVLLCEGDEDLDHCLFDGGKLVRTEQQQYKDLSERISARSKAVYESIFNFLISFRYHHQAGRGCRFSFTTTASVASQKTDERIPADVIKTWSTATAPAAVAGSRKDLVISLKGIVDTYKEKYAKKKDGGQDEGKQKKLEEAVFYIEQSSLWDPFLGCVQWNTEAPNGDNLRRIIIQNLAKREEFQGVGEGVLILFASRLIDEVLVKCSRPEPDQRVLDSKTLSALLTLPIEELKAWAQTRGQEQLLKELAEVKVDVASIKSTISIINKRLPASLEEVTEISLKQLAKRAQFQIGATTVSIRRSASDALAKWVHGGTCVIIGEPGIGKSAVLYRLTEILQNEGHDVVIMTVEKFLGQPHLTQELHRWTGEKPGYVLIDGLDAQRGGRGSLYDSLDSLVQVGSRWRIIGSIRRFDLENDPRLQRFFVGQPHEVYRPIGSKIGDHILNVRCVEIPRLDDSELLQIQEQSSSLASLLDRSSPALRELLHNPFNLSLAAQLLTIGKCAADFATITTQVDLLDKYWDERVSEDPASCRIPREALLRSICELMMQIPDLQLSEAKLDREPQLERLGDLSHSGLIARPEPMNIEFSHNILFDYAISRYWLKSNTGSNRATSVPQDYQALCLQLEQRGDLVLLVYPSLEMYFARLWEKDLARQHFWQCVLTLSASPSISPVLLVAPAAVAARLARQPDELQPLCAALASGSESAHKMVQRLVTALSNLPSEEVTLVGAAGGPWCALAEWLAETKEPRLLDATRRLLFFLTPVERPRAASTAPQGSDTPPTAEQQGAAHRAALAYFDHVTSLSGAGLRVLPTAIQLACRNSAPEPAAVISRLRAVLGHEALDAYGYVTVPAIARSLKWLFPHDIDFVAKFYISAFQYRETRREETVLSGGPVMQMQSNRQQDYNGGLYELEEQFSMLLEKDAGLATRVLIKIFEAWQKGERCSSWKFQRVIRKETTGDDLPEEAPVPEIHEIQMDSQIVRFQGDLSAMSDGSSDHDNHEMNMLNKWTEWLDSALTDRSLENQVDAVITTLFAYNALERIWMRLMRIAARHPDVIGRKLLPLASHPVVFSAYDRQEDVRVFLQSLWPLLTHEERLNIASKVQIFLQQTPAESQQWASHVADSVLAQIQESPAAPPSPVPQRGRMWSGVSANRQRPESENTSPILYEIVARVKTWADKQAALTRSEAASLPLAQIREDLRQLHRELTNPPGQVREAQLCEEGWGYLADVGTKLARRDDVLAHAGLFEELTQFLLDAAQCASPYPQQDEPLPADVVMSWGFPVARLEAAIGLGALSWERPEDLTIIEAIEQLALHDNCSKVRWQVASYARQIHHRGGHLSESYLAHILNNETSSAVVAHWMENGTLWDIAHEDIDRAIKIVERISERFPSIRMTDNSGSNQKRDVIRDLAINYYIGWLVRFSHPHLTDRMTEYLSHPWCQAAQQIPHLLHGEAIVGLAEPMNAEKRQIREQTWSLLERLCSAALAQFNVLASQSPAASTSAGQHYLGVQHTLHNLAKMAWHHLEAFQQERLREGDKGVQLGPIAIRQGFWEHARPVLEMLTNVPIPSVADELIKALSGAIDFARKDALILAARSLTNAISLGFATDTFAALTTEKFLRRYLTEQRTLLQQNKGARDALLQMLSPFVDMGWPAPQKLVFRLADAFR